MSKIVLISCVSKKSQVKSKAEKLYLSPLFKYNLQYAKSLNPDKIFILSAKYGLVGLNEEIEPYNETLNKMSSDKIKEWAKKVIEKLEKETNLREDEFIILAGEKYRRFLVPYLKNYKIPLQGLRIGKQLQFLKNSSNKCEEIHKLFNKAERFNFPFDEKKIPQNGIYIIFEKGEKAHKGDRIVRIGTHTGENQLASRLIQHFVNENKDRSIFRKNIGRALLNKQKDSYLEKWEIDLTTKDAKEKFGDLIDVNKQKEIEKEVTKYIQNNFSFIIIEINDKNKRLEIESKIISTISNCKICKPSENWLGLSSPKDKIREGGLWLVNELYKSPLNSNEVNELISILKNAK
jgi:hypothetical protein